MCFSGVAHSDELLYLFPYKGMIMNEEEARISRQMVDLWTSFAAKGSVYKISKKGIHFKIVSFA